MIFSMFVSIVKVDGWIWPELVRQFLQVLDKTMSYRLMLGKRTHI